MTSLIYTWILIGLLSFHPLHLSVTNIDFNCEKNRLTLSVKLFSDDFANRLRNEYGAEILVERDSLSQKDKAVFTPYIKENLQIRLDGKYLPMDQWRLDSVTNNFEASWMFFSCDMKNSSKEVSIRNTLLFDVFRDQKNLVIISVCDQERAFQFTRRKPVITTRF